MNLDLVAKSVSNMVAGTLNDVLKTTSVMLSQSQVVKDYEKFLSSAVTAAQERMKPEKMFEGVNPSELLDAVKGNAKVGVQAAGDNSKNVAYNAQGGQDKGGRTV